MGNVLAVLLMAVSLCLVTTGAHAVKPAPDELASSAQWVQAKFSGGKPVVPLSPGLEVVSNHDPVWKNSRLGKPFKLGDKEFTRGLFCHAPSKIVVRLPGPGKVFTANVGVDALAGGGTVVCSVSMAGKDAFRSDVLRGGQPGVPVSVDLGGAKAFTLETGDAGDGISCDQVDWADAKALLEDGTEIWIADLPMAQSPALSEPGVLPFSFVYDGQPSTSLLPTWKSGVASKKLDDERTEHVLTYVDPKTGLELRCVVIEYHDFPTVEWTLYFKNTGTADTPIIENIQAADLSMERGDTGEFLLHHNVGSPANATDYGPIETKLEPNLIKKIGAAGGRPTNTDMSYFNVESTGRDGLIVVVGWPGQWSSEFARDGGKRLHIRAGQELTHFKLLPGEEVRSPLIVLQFWNGDWGRAQNVWRRWMMAHSMPKPGGQLPQPMAFGGSSRAYEEMIKADTEKQIMFIDRYVEERIKIDYWWMDAGWYVQQTGWPQVGTWEVDPKRFPNGFRPISDHAHAKGIKILVWFEPERVAAGTWLTENHPEWIFGGKKGGLLNLGNPEAWTWLTDHIDKLLTDQGIDLYRQDFNMDPLALWRANDTEDRQGITEIKHVTGYLAYWDELRRRHPDMLIDSCASGGRRNDVETMRRAVPLWRSDYAFEPVGHQGMTYGISMWLPFHGTGTVACINAPYYGGGFTPVEPYAFWSNVAPGLGCGVDMRVKEIDYEALRKLFNAWRSVNANYYGDFYPLTKYSLEKDAWIAWQFDRPEAGEGMIQVFRRDASIYVTARLPLKGLDADSEYDVKDVTTNESRTLKGRELMDAGLPVQLPERPQAATFAYVKVK